MSLSYGSRGFELSFELFPPKTDAGYQALWKHVDELMAFRPSMITCTYGAGGSTRDKTLEIVAEARRRHEITVASHLTCVGAVRDDLRAYLAEARERKIDAIVALRGDPPQGETRFRPVEGGLSYANELVALIRAEFPEFGVIVAGYPETHQEAPSPEADLENLRRKVDAGAEVVVTQLFFHNADFFRFRERCQQIGITIPIVPGILPVTNLPQIQRITSLCGAKLPAEFIRQLERKDDQDWQFNVGVEFASKQVQELLNSGLPGLHFYVLNKSQATAEVLRNVGLPHE